MKYLFATIMAAMAVFVSGCANYKWGTSVPEEYRKVAVPVFENLTEVSELGPVVAQYTLREFQREGSYRIVKPEDAAIEIQGVLRSFTRDGIAYDRSRGMRASEYRYVVMADVSFIDKRTGKILLERNGIKGETTFLTYDDLLTGQKNAAFRIASDISRQIVNEALSLPCKKDKSTKGAVEGVQK
ncbi:MAG: hypothetical protein J6R18_02590 [Kiritimatiellae bacterium]|nr:hypothetical protein [Kiritimatiellia bacterium]